MYSNTRVYSLRLTGPAPGGLDVPAPAPQLLRGRNGFRNGGGALVRPLRGRRGRVAGRGRGRLAAPDSARRRRQRRRPVSERRPRLG
eukprot:scaffold1696_cov49-Phaeocystis_antarctica.AAC.3